MIVWLVTPSQFWYHAQIISSNKRLNNQLVYLLNIFLLNTHTSHSKSKKHCIYTHCGTSSFNNQQCHRADIMSVSMVTPLPVGNPLGERLRQPWMSGNNRHGILSMLRLMCAHLPVGTHEITCESTHMFTFRFVDRTRNVKEAQAFLYSCERKSNEKKQ